MIVTRVDSDTFEARIGNETKLVTVRVIGYNAPEKDQPFGDTATKFLKSLLEGREVLVEPDVQALDKYGRRLYHVWVPNVLVSELMLLTGLGLQMTIPPNVRHVDFLTRAEKAGREIGLGIGVRTAPSPTQSVTLAPTTTGYVGNARSLIFHRPECQWAQAMSPQNRVTLRSREEAIAKGFRPCKVCQP